MIEVVEACMMENIAYEVQVDEELKFRWMKNCCNSLEGTTETSYLYPAHRLVVR
jgi:hypothetical protein